MMVLMLFGRLEVFPTMLMFVAAMRAGTRSRYGRQAAQRGPRRLTRRETHASTRGLKRQRAGE